MAYGGQELISSESIQEKIWKCLQPDYGGVEKQQSRTVEEMNSIPRSPWINFPAPSSTPLYARSRGSTDDGSSAASQGFTRMLNDSMNSLSIKDEDNIPNNNCLTSYPTRNVTNGIQQSNSNITGFSSGMPGNNGHSHSRNTSSNLFNSNALSMSKQGFNKSNNSFSNQNKGLNSMNNFHSTSNGSNGTHSNGLHNPGNGFPNSSNTFNSLNTDFINSSSKGISLSKDTSSSCISDGFTSWTGGPSCWSTGLTTSLGNGLFPSSNVSPTSSNSSYTSSNNSLSSSSDSESSIRIKWKAPDSSSSMLSNQQPLFSSQRRFEELSSSASLEERYLQLTRQIESFARIHAPSKDVLDRVENLRSSLLVIIWKFFPLARLHLFGSCCNGFGSDTSDVDLCLIISPGRKPNQLDRAERYLKDLEIVLTTIFGFRDVEFVNARVPILKFSDAFSGCHCDLSVNNEMAVRNTHLLRAYSKMDDRVRPLVMAVKKWASARKINDATQGTLSSYAIVLMCIHYLQCGCKPPVVISLQKYYPEYFSSDSDVNQLHYFEPWKMIPCNTSENKLSVGELFVSFFQYYANVFSWDTQVISVREGCCVMKQKYKGFEDKYMCVEDPYESYNTTRTVYNLSLFNLIKREFRRANWRLSERLSLEHIT